MDLPFVECPRRHMEILTEPRLKLWFVPEAPLIRGRGSTLADSMRDDCWESAVEVLRVLAPSSFAGQNSDSSIASRSSYPNRPRRSLMRTTVWCLCVGMVSCLGAGLGPQDKLTRSDPKRLQKSPAY